MIDGADDSENTQAMRQRLATLTAAQLPGVGVLVTSPDAVVLDANAYLARRLGQTPASMRGQATATWRFPAWTWHDESPDDGDVSMDVALCLADGGEWWVRLFCRPWRDTSDSSAGDVLGMLYTVVDLEPQRREMAELRQSEERWRAIVQNPFDFVSVVDRDGVYRYVNHHDPALADTPLVGRATVYDFTDAEYLDVTRKAIEHVFATGESTHFEAHSAPIDGWFSTIIGPVYRDGVVIAASMLSRNINREKRTQQALGESEAQFRALAEESPNAIFISLDGRFAYANRHCEQLFGFTRPELYHVEFDCLRLVHPMDVERIRQTYASTLLGDNVAPCEHLAMTHDGRQMNVILATRRIDYKGECAVLGVVTDITEHKRVEQALRVANEQLKQAMAELRHAQVEEVRLERLHAMGQMASGIAHDFNNRLMGIVGFGDILLDTLREEGASLSLEHLAEQIIETATEAGEVASRLKEFYRDDLAAEVLVEVDLHALVRRSIAITEPHWKIQAHARGVEIRMVTDLEPVPPIAGNNSELCSCLTNLILNAADAMPDGGTLTVATRLVGDYVRLSVRDTGVGMDEAVQARCLEPFFTTKSETGSGLGLSTTFGIVQRHGGYITIESAVGRGTAFNISLPPLVPSSAQTVPPLPVPVAIAQAGAVGLRAARILLVEDDDTVRTIMTYILRRAGYFVETAIDGRNGLEIFRPGDFELLLTDMALPGCNGPELAQQLKALQPNLQVIMLTGFGNLVDPSNERLSAIDLIVAKPVGRDHLLASIASLLAADDAAPGDDVPASTASPVTARRLGEPSSSGTPQRR